MACTSYASSETVASDVVVVDLINVGFTEVVPIASDERLTSLVDVVVMVVTLIFVYSVCFEIQPLLMK